MLIAIKKVDLSPVMKEIQAHPFVWVIFLVISISILGNILAIVWMILGDMKKLVFRAFRAPRRFVKDTGRYITDYLSRRGRK